MYETETFSLIDKKSIKVENVTDFCWSPADPIFALFVPEQGGGNQPARVSCCYTLKKIFFDYLYFKNLKNSILFIYIIGESVPNPKQSRVTPKEPLQCE